MFGLFKSKKNRRLADRYDTPTLEIVFDGDAYETADWNLTGCRLTGYKGRRKKNDRVTINTIDGEKKNPCYVSLAATVIRRRVEKREIALRFDDLDNTGRQYLKDLMSGKSGGTGGRRFGGRQGFGNRG